MVRSIRRVVTGHDEAGRSCIVSDEILKPGRPNVYNPPSDPGTCVTGLWRLQADPSTDAADIVSDRPLEFGAPPGGNTFLIAEFPGGSQANKEIPAEILATLGTHEKPASEQAGMHRTRTIDYIIILTGRMTLILEDGGETEVGPGDVVIQRGTNHAWTNPDEEPCVYVAVVCDAKADF